MGEGEEGVQKCRNLSSVTKTGSRDGLFQGEDPEIAKAPGVSAIEKLHPGQK